MRAIFERLIGSEVSRRISIGADEICRPIPVGGNWNKLRVGISFCFTDTGQSTIFGDPRFFIGVCSRFKTWGSYNAHAIGMASSASTMTRTAGPPSSWALTLSNALAIGQSEFLTGGTQVLTANSTVTQRHFCSLDIDKTTPSAVTFRFFRSTNSIAGNVDLSPTVCRDLMDMQTPTLSGFTLTTNTGSVAINEALNGALDCINIAWSMTAPQLEVIQAFAQVYDATG